MNVSPHRLQVTGQSITTRSRMPRSLASFIASAIRFSPSFRAASAASGPNGFPHRTRQSPKLRQTFLPIATNLVFEKTQKQKEPGNRRQKQEPGNVLQHHHSNAPQRLGRLFDVATISGCSKIASPLKCWVVREPRPTISMDASMRALTPSSSRHPLLRGNAAPASTQRSRRLDWSTSPFPAGVADNAW
jgi:hypothetical protein